METLEEPLAEIALILLLGVGAQWLAWRLRVPAILVLLVVGLLAGDLTGLLDPDALLGDLLLPVVSLSVAVILFEGGLGLSIQDLRGSGRVVRNLVTVGMLLTGAIATFAARAALDVSWSVAALLGAIVVVTGPTVIGPLLRDIRPVGRVATILRGEGILIDPIGALLALLVFEAILAGALGDAGAAVAVVIGQTVAIGLVLGLAGAAVVTFVLARYLVPDTLHNAVALVVAVAAFTAADQLQEESGLLAVTVMGVALASQRRVSVRRILEFSETLRLLLISGLFVLLAARIDLDSLRDHWWQALLFLAVLIVVARPLSVLVSAIGGGLTRRETTFLAMLAPRGIVAAAVSSVFAIRLDEAAEPGAELLVPVTFVVIVGSIAFYGILARPLAKRLELADPEPEGVLLLGAHGWARELAHVLAERDVKVVLVDADRRNVAAARLEGLNAVYGSIFSERAFADVDLGGIGRMLALTPSDEVNSLAARELSHLLGSKEVYQLAPAKGPGGERHAPGRHLLARILFGPEHTFDLLEERFRRGGVLKATQLTEEYDLEALRRHYGEAALPLLAIHDGRLRVNAVDGPLRPAPGDVVVTLVDEAPERPRERARERRARRRDDGGRREGAGSEEEGTGAEGEVADVGDGERRETT